MEKIVEKMLDFAAVMWYNIRGYLFFFFTENFVKNFTILLLLLIDKYIRLWYSFFNCEKFHNRKNLG